MSPAVTGSSLVDIQEAGTADLHKVHDLFLEEYQLQCVVEIKEHLVIRRLCQRSRAVEEREEIGIEGIQ